MGEPLAATLLAAALAVFLALLEYQGTLMSEPLAATLPRRSAGVLSWAPLLGGARALRGCRRSAARRAGAGAARVPGVALLASSSRAGSGRLAPVPRPGGAPARRRRPSSSPPGRSATRSRSTAFVPISTGGGQVLFAGTYLPSDGDPEKVGAEVVARHPELFGPRAMPSACGSSRSSPRLAAAALPGPGNRPGALADGRANSSGTTSPSEPLEYAGFVADQGRPDLVARPARRDARAGLGGAALGAGRLRPARPRACSPGGAAGRRWCWPRLPRDHRDQRPAGRLAAAGAGDAAAVAGRSPESAATVASAACAQSWSYLTWKVSLMKVAVSAPLKVQL